MKEITVESLFGLNAGVVWRALNQHGPSNLANLIETTSLSREEVFGALGWLGRENKIVMEQKGRAMIFSLREKEAHLAVRQEAAAGSKPRGKSKSRKGCRQRGPEMLIGPKLKPQRAIAMPI